MTTPHSRSLVSLAVTTIVMFALGACIRAPSRPAIEGLASMKERPLAIRFDNGAREDVHVYLVAEKRQWLLGRVPPGAKALLRIPGVSLVGSPGFVRLAVLTGGRMTLQVARDPFATFTVAQPASEIFSQHWMFAHGQLNSLGLWDRRVDVGRR